MSLYICDIAVIPASNLILLNCMYRDSPLYPSSPQNNHQRTTSNIKNNRSIIPSMLTFAKIWPFDISAL